MRDVTCHLDQIDTLPASLKDKVLHLMCKRGKLNDSNINLVSNHYDLYCMIHYPGI